MQLVLDRLAPVAASVDLLPLGVADAPEMLALARLTEPGPFGPRITVMGARESDNYFTLDGVTATDRFYNTLTAPLSVDAVQEFKVQSNLYSAESGTFGGARTLLGAMSCVEGCTMPSAFVARLGPLGTGLTGLGLRASGDFILPQGYWLVAWPMQRIASRRVSLIVGLAATVVLFALLVDGVLFKAGLRMADASFRAMDELIEPETAPPAAAAADPSAVAEPEAATFVFGVVPWIDDSDP